MMLANDPSQLRTEIDARVAAGETEKVLLSIRELWRVERGPASAAFVVSRCEGLRAQARFLVFRIAILRAMTIEPIVPLLRAAAFTYGIDLQVHVGDFNAYAPEILDQQSSLYRFHPDVVILAVRTPDVAPDLWQEYGEMTPETVEDALQRVCASFQQWIAAFRRHSSAALVIHSMERPSLPNFGVLDGQRSTSQVAAIAQLNAEIGRLAREQMGVFILDYEGLVARQGRDRWNDPRKWLIARMPIAADQLIHLAEEWMRFVLPLTGRTAKVLVVDLDNTLWGGVIGEDGMAGIKLGSDYPGAAYQSLQRALLDLYRKGILLAVCSKNNPEDAMEAMGQHPEMVLRPEHFACLRINWNDKEQGLREIASELNLGIDSLAFLDDNPFERERVRSSVPEVMVIDLPEDPMLYAAAVRNHPALERLTLSSEDEQRTALYQKQRQRVAAEQSFQSKEDFYRFLQQRAEIAPLAAASLGRIAQLTQKTSQFNMTTHRYSDQEIADLAVQPGWRVVSIRMRDRFGDHGLVGVAITHDQGNTCEIESFLLSCRVIGRQVETALLSHLARSAAQRGMDSLSGWYLPTRKNAPAGDFYPRHGFQREEQVGENSRWRSPLGGAPLTCPDWIELTVANGENK